MQTRDTKLLLALRPHLQQARQKKVDQAVKTVKIICRIHCVERKRLLQDLL